MRKEHFHSIEHFRARGRTLIWGLFYGAAVLLLGSLGFILIEGWSALDAFYMTVITLTTVGYGEVHPLTTGGRLFTILLIFAGVGGATYFFTSIVGMVVEGELARIRGFRRMRKNIESYKNHTIVCGCGRLGRIVVKELLDAGQDVVVVELNPESIGWIERHGVAHVQGTAYEDEILKAAGIGRAKSLLSLLPKDSDNVYVTLCARDLNPNLSIIARTEEDSGEKKLLRAGANQVLAPYRVTGNRIVQRLIRPNVSEFLELAAGKSGAQLAIEEVVVTERSTLAGKTLEESELRNRTGVVIAAFISPSGATLFNPGAKSVIEPGSTMIVMGEKAALTKLSELI